MKNKVEEIVREVNGTKYYFYCRSIRNNYGTTHRCDLYTDYLEIGHGKYSYSNRPWEKYRFQSAMLDAIRNGIADRKAKIKAQYKAVHGIKRLSREKEEHIYDDDKLLANLEALKQIVYDGEYGTDEEKENLEALDRLVKMTEALAEMGMFKGGK